MLNLAIRCGSVGMRFGVKRTLQRMEYKVHAVVYDATSQGFMPARTGSTPDVLHSISYAMLRMKSRRKAQDIPTLKLSDGERSAILAEVSTLLAETLTYEHIYRDGEGPLDSSKWKEVKAKDNFRLYKERKPSTATTPFFADDVGNRGIIEPPTLLSLRDLHSLSSSSPTAFSAADDMESIVTSMKHPDVPLLIAAGHVEGSLEDIAFGGMASDELAWRLRTAYMKDNFADTKILATIRAPTADAPFDSVLLKWLAIETPSPFMSHQREFLVIDASGIAVDAFGNQYAYGIMHPFQHPAIPKDPKITRGLMSTVTISRQTRADMAHVFARGFVSPSNSEVSPDSMVKLAATTLTSLANIVEASYSKKLTWLLSRNAENGPLPPPSTPTCCKQRSSFAKSTVVRCQACGQSTCGRCTLQRNMVVEVTSTNVKEMQLPFCFACVIKAKQMCPREAAIATLVPNHIESSERGHERHLVDTLTTSIN